MSKDVSTYPESAVTPDTTASNAAPNTVSGIEVPDASTLMDSYANGLMDELFNDVEYALDEGLELPTETAQVEDPEPIATPQIVLPATLINPPSSALTKIEDDENSSELALIRDELEKAKRRERRLDFLLLGAAFTALVLTAGIWLSNRQNSQGVPTTSSNPRLSPEEIQAQSDAEFLTYLDRSLEMIDRRAAMQPPTANANSTGGAAGSTAMASSALPPVLVPGSSTGQPLIPQGLGSGQRVIERVYVPLYQPPGGASPSATATAPGTVPFRNIAETYGNATSSLPTPSSSPAASSGAAANPSPTNSPQAAASSSSTAPVGNHTLVGIMELGDRSAALFDIEGVTQRFFAGEAIASSGWTLVTVSNQEAIIRRNGEIRSVFVGQKF
ncbi:MAG: hypothetical protein ACTS2F_03080 [Thainema sp.]